MRKLYLQSARIVQHKSIFSTLLKTLSCSCVVLLAILWATQVFAIILTPLSYDMLNGNGQASGGAYNYWDKFYTGAGNTMQDNAFLSGGLGDLTDGIVTNEHWFNVENSAGTGPYVGWLFLNPTVVFHFSGGL